jgi:hypothetical protein
MSRTYKWNIISLLLVIGVSAAASSAPAQTRTSREYPYLYKSSRAMGMGGAYTAIGGRVDTLFYNPAGLTNIPTDKGWEVNILDLSVEAAENSIDFLKDLQDAFDTGDLNSDGSTDDDQQRAVNDVLSEYLGEHLQVRVSDFTSFGKRFDSLAFGMGALASGRVDAIPHQGFGPEGILEVDADATYGALGGISFPLGKGFAAGFSVKYLYREAVTHAFTPQELVEHQDNLGDYIQDELAASGSAVGFDAGAIWSFSPDSWWRPAIGVSVLNIGDLDFKDAGVIPMTVNAGIAINPRITTFRSWLIGLDYVDIASNFEQDSDMAKRLRFGTELQLFDTTAVEFALRAGMYQGYPTFGADLRLLTFLFSGTMYSEEVGAYAGQDKNTRYLVTFNFGW